MGKLSKSSSPGWMLCCDVCNECFDSYSEWSRHLWQKKHQQICRLQCRQWSDEVKECAIVAYLQVPVIECVNEVMNVFTDRKKGRFVTDFVWWNERPKVAVFQFESSEKVNEVISKGLLKAEIKLSNCRIQVKRALDMMEFEWDEFVSSVPQDDRKPLKIDRLDEENGTNEPRKREKICESDSSHHPIPAKISQLMNVTCDNQLKTTEKSLFIQYREICDHVLIPELEYNNVLKLIDNLKIALTKSYPKSKLYIFRHWYLKMWNNGANELLIFLDMNGLWEENNWNLDIIARYDRRDNINQTLSQHIMSIFLECLGLEKMSPEKLNRQRNNNMLLDRAGTWFMDPITNIVFNVITNPMLVLETQTCRLLKYLCEFDPRASPVLLIITHWARINGLRFSRVIVTNTKFPFSGAEPVALEWLVMMFLCKKRVIPTVRQVIDRPHKKIWINDEEDIGFEIDMGFAKAWSAKKSLPVPGSDDFVKSVLGLVQEFFKFYSELPPQTLILNTRDAEVIKLKYFLETPPRNLLSSTKLTFEEITSLKSKSAYEISKNRNIILNPLCLSCFLSLDLKSTNQEMIKLTAQKMDGISFYGQVNNKDYIDLQSLLRC